MTSNHNLSSRIIILTEHFWPSTGATSQLITDLADDLSCSGINPLILTSTSGDTSRGAYHVIRLSGYIHDSVGILGKLLVGASFFFRSIVWLLFNNDNNDPLLIVSNPPFIGIVGLVLKLLRRKRYLFLLQDVFPRSASLSGILPSRGPLFAFWTFLIRQVIAHSDSTIVLSDSMLARCVAEFGFKSKLITIPNWSVIPDTNIVSRANSLAKKWGVCHEFTVQYSGNFGRMHDILTILEAARLLKQYPVKFLFVGGGAKVPQITRYSSVYKLDNVLLKDYQSRALLPKSLAACDVSIVSLIPGAEDTVAPSKLYGILSSRKPVILISSLNSEQANLIRDYECGLVVEQGDVLSLVEAILKFQSDKTRLKTMSENSYHAYTYQFGRAQSIKEYVRLIRSTFGQ